MTKMNITIDIDSLIWGLSEKEKQEVIKSIVTFVSYEDFSKMIVEVIKSSDEPDLLESELLEALKGMKNDNTR